MRSMKEHDLVRQIDHSESTLHGEQMRRNRSLTYHFIFTGILYNTRSSSMIDIAMAGTNWFVWNARKKCHTIMLVGEKEGK